MNDPILGTTLLILLTVAVLIAWDVKVAFFNSVPNSKDTISGQLKRAGERVRAIPFGFGVLGGHFFWPGPELVPQPWAALILCVLAVLTTFATLNKRRLSIVALFLGIVFGHLLWPQ